MKTLSQSAAEKAQARIFRKPRSRQAESGVALAVALVILVVITLIGVTAIRRAQLQARLSQNAEATVQARSTASVNAQALLNATNSNQLLSQAAGDNYVACWLSNSSYVTTAVYAPCASPYRNASGNALTTFASTLPSSEKDYSYFQVQRAVPATLPTSTLRGAGLSGVAYQFANFSLLSGYDASATKDGMAEVSQSLLQPAAKVPGITEG